MQPYQKASEKQRSSGETQINIAKNLGFSAVGGGAAKLGTHFAGKLIPKVAALISPYLPDNLSQAGLSKIDPRLGKFIKGAQDEGYSYDELRKYIGDKIEKSEKTEEKRNIIEQESPELHQFIDQEIKKGINPIQAGALAYNDKRFTQAINKLKNQHKVNWSNLIETVYGNGKTAQTQSQSQNQTRPNALDQEALNPPGSTPNKNPSAEFQAFTNPQNQPIQPQQQQGQGPGAQAFLQAIQQSTDELRKIRGG